MSWLRETWRIVRSVGLALLVATVATTIVDQIINSRLESLLLSDDGGGAQLWILAASSLLNSLVFPVLMTALCLYGIMKARGGGESLTAFFARVGQQIYIETLRMWGSCLRWGLLFVLPGVVRLLQLIYVPFVVCVHKPYDQGDADALKTSSRYFRKTMFRTFAAILAFHIAIPLVLTDLLDPWRTFARTPVSAVLCSVVDLLLAIIAAQIFFRLFESARKELHDESVFQLERHQDPGQGAHV